MALPVARPHAVDNQPSTASKDHLSLLIRTALAATALVTGTGLYLLLHQTAYKTPWSLTAARACSSCLRKALLPLHGRQALGLRGDGSSPSSRSCSKRSAASHLASEPGDGAVRSRAVQAGPGARLHGRHGAGGATVLVCVTLLKYFHEFVESVPGGDIR